MESVWRSPEALHISSVNSAGLISSVQRISHYSITSSYRCKQQRQSTMMQLTCRDSPIRSWPKQLDQVAVKTGLIYAPSSSLRFCLNLHVRTMSCVSSTLAVFNEIQLGLNVRVTSLAVKSLTHKQMIPVNSTHKPYESNTGTGSILSISRHSNGSELRKWNRCVPTHLCSMHNHCQVLTAAAHSHLHVARSTWK